ncbi:serine hydrolase domain-containing protein [Streptantibioticus silvisoli]|uniref:Serine hydrolase domain-containing protein n=1 Tax=Streptantibioticus silvisoli TaxID=2705255 RepID=A0ABT6VT17_9ACTN|nr:serine hydrolase domain-containing protein [Streptantibioticus silvisoli]MDI5961618.1 serine hydrolase domain-containing protein [Streptantibioticus silvisoli]
MTVDELTALVLADLAAACEPPAPAHPWCAGAVVLAGVGDDIVLHEAAGHALRYAAWDERAEEPVELPPHRWLPARRDTVFDLASVTKLFTAIVAVQQTERGVIDLDTEVAYYLPEFGAAGKQEVTVRQLLTHTSGLPAELPFHASPEGPQRLRLLWEQRPLTPPGEVFRYSDPNLITLGLLLERVTGTRLDRLVADGVTGPLGMTSTRFNPPAGWRHRIAATEDQRRPWGRLDRGMVHGEVHDENAHALGGIAGHAGLFADAADLGRLCRALLSGGAGVLRPQSVALMTADHGTPGHPRGLGFDLDQPSFMGALAGPRTVGHTGFTGTGVVLDHDSGAWVVLLANSVHPVRTRRSGHGPRPSVATHVARYAAG